MSKRDIYECANQLGGYVGPTTNDDLAGFLLRESEAAAELADDIVRLRRLVDDMFVVILNRCDEKDPKVKDVLLRAIEETTNTDLIPE